MTRTVGHRDRSELIKDPAEALRLGKVLDAMLWHRPSFVRRAVWFAPQTTR